MLATAADGGRPTSMQTMDDFADGYVVPQCGDSPCSDYRGSVPPVPPAPDPAGIWQEECTPDGGGGARQNRQTYAGSTGTSVTNLLDCRCYLHYYLNSRLCDYR